MKIFKKLIFIITGIVDIFIMSWYVFKNMFVKNRL